MRGISTSAQTYISSTSRVRIANLISIVIASSIYIYLTDYGRDITFKGATYRSGKLKSISNLKQSKDLKRHFIFL